MIATAAPTTTWYLVLAAVLFGVGTVGVLVRRNPLIMLMCVELMLNAVNLTFVALSKKLADIGGQTTVFFVLVVAAAEVVVGLGIIVAILRRKPRDSVRGHHLGRAAVHRAAIDDLGHAGVAFGDQGEAGSWELGVGSWGFVPCVPRI